MAIDPITGVNNASIVTEAITNTFVNLLQNVPYLWDILRAAGLVFIAYILFLFIRSFLTLRTNRRIRSIEKKVDLILEKLGIDSSDIKEEKKKLKEKREEKKKDSKTVKDKKAPAKKKISKKNKK